MFTVSMRGKQSERGWTATFSEKFSDLHFSLLEFVFFFLTSILAVGPTQTLIQYIMRALRLGLGVNHSFTPSVEINNEWIYTSTPPYAFKAWTDTILFTFCVLLRFYTLSTGKWLIEFRRAAVPPSSWPGCHERDSNKTVYNIQIRWNCFEYLNNKEG